MTNAEETVNEAIQAQQDEFRAWLTPYLGSTHVISANGVTVSFTVTEQFIEDGCAELEKGARTYGPYRYRTIGETGLMNELYAEMLGFGTYPFLIHRFRLDEEAGLLKPKPPTESWQPCPDCESALMRSEGCLSCPACGWSACSG